MLAWRTPLREAWSPSFAPRMSSGGDPHLCLASPMPLHLRTMTCSAMKHEYMIVTSVRHHLDTVSVLPYPIGLVTLSEPTLPEASSDGLSTWRHLPQDSMAS